MDDIHYGSGPGGGTMVTLRKRLAGPKTEPSDSAIQEEGTDEWNANVRQSDDVTILDLKGKITIGSGTWQLRNAVQEVDERRRQEGPHQHGGRHDDRLLAGSASW